MFKLSKQRYMPEKQSMTKTIKMRRFTQLNRLLSFTLCCLHWNNIRNSLLFSLHFHCFFYLLTACSTISAKKKCWSTNMDSICVCVNKYLLWTNWSVCFNAYIVSFHCAEIVFIERVCVCARDLSERYFIRTNSFLCYSCDPNFIRKKLNEEMKQLLVLRVSDCPKTWFH